MALARADLLARCGDVPGVAQAYQLAIAFERDPAVRQFHQRRATVAAGV